MPLTHDVTHAEVAIPALAASGAPISLPGRLSIPDTPLGLVLFAHGSGSSRLSPRNEFVASVLHESWIGTLLFDLLTVQEANDRANVFDISLLADRLVDAIRFVTGHEQTASLPLGLFGASTGAAAALVAAVGGCVGCLVVAWIVVGRLRCGLEPVAHRPQPSVVVGDEWSEPPPAARQDRVFDQFTAGTGSHERPLVEHVKRHKRQAVGRRSDRHRVGVEIGRAHV